MVNMESYDEGELQYKRDDIDQDLLHKYKIILT